MLKLVSKKGPDLIDLDLIDEDLRFLKGIFPDGGPAIQPEELEPELYAEPEIKPGFPPTGLEPRPPEEVAREFLEAEHAKIPSRQIQRGPVLPTISEAPEKTLSQRILEQITPFKATRVEQIAKAQNIRSIAKQLGQPIRVVQENYQEAMGAVMKKQGPTTVDLLVLGAAPFIALGLSEHAASTLLGLAKFAGAFEVINFGVSMIKDEDYQFLAGKGASELLPEESSQLFRETVDIAEFIAVGLAAVGASRAAPKLVEKITKDIFTEFKAPKRIIIPARKVASIFRTGEEISPEELDLIKSLNLDGHQYRMAVKQGLDIKIPAEKISTIVDKPYWIKLKSIFGRGPAERITRVERAGEQIIDRAPAGELPPPRSVEGSYVRQIWEKKNLEAQVAAAGEAAKAEKPVEAAPEPEPGVEVPEGKIEVEPSAERWEEIQKRISQIEKHPDFVKPEIEGRVLRDELIELEKEAEIHKPAAEEKAKAEIKKEKPAEKPPEEFEEPEAERKERLEREAEHKKISKMPEDEYIVYRLRKTADLLDKQDKPAFANRFRQMADSWEKNEGESRKVILKSNRDFIDGIKSNYQQIIKERKAAEGPRVVITPSAIRKTPKVEKPEDLIGQKFKAWEKGKRRHWGTITGIEGNEYTVFDSENPKDAQNFKVKIAYVKQWIAEKKIYPASAKEKPAEKPPEGYKPPIGYGFKKIEGELTLKEQKEYLIKEIDKAIKTAKEAEDEDLKISGVLPGQIQTVPMDDETRKKYGVITIEVPGDGRFVVLNTKQSLKHFKKAARGFPTAKWKISKPGRKPEKVPSPMGVRMKGVEYYNPFRPRKQKIVMAKKDQRQFYVKGFYTDNKYLIKVDKKPESKTDYLETDKTFENSIVDITKAAEKAIPAEMVAETFPMRDLDVEDIAERRYERFQPRIHAVTENGEHYIYQANYVDAVLTEHPNSKVSILPQKEKGERAIVGTLFFEKGGDVVGVVTPLTPEGEGPPSGKLEDLHKVIQEGYAELTGKAKPEEVEVKPERLERLKKPKVKLPEELKLSEEEGLALVKKLRESEEKAEVGEFTVEQRAVIGTHVAELGSIKKVAEYYPGKGEADTFARERAEELFGKKEFKKKIEETREKIEQWAKANIEAAGEADVVKLQSLQRVDEYYIVSRDPSQKDKWRATRFAKLGDMTEPQPYGHDTFRTRDNAISSLSGNSTVEGPPIGSREEYKVVETKAAKKPEVEKETAELSKLEADKRVKLFRSSANTLQKQIDAKRHPAIGEQRITARRARIAGGMAREADRLEKIQNILRGMADDIEAGTLPKALEGIKSKAHVEDLLNRNWKSARPDVHIKSVKELMDGLKGVSGMSEIKSDLRQLFIREPIIPGGYYVSLYRESEINALGKLIKLAEKKRLNRYAITDVKDGVIKSKRIISAGLDTEARFNAAEKALENYLKPPSEEVIREQKLKAMERELIGTKIPGFFPTPKSVVNKMLEKAVIEADMSVLEPSAGKGDIADAIREMNVGLDIYEINPRLVEYLREKGYKVVQKDFLEVSGKFYQRIVMNPPFEQGQDIDHVKKAYELLMPGGRIVSIMSEGPFFRSDKKAVAFREWFEEVGGKSEKVPEKAFATAESFRQTGVSFRIVTIDKPLEGAPSGLADTGGYADIGGYEEPPGAEPGPSAMDLPEIVELAKQLMKGRLPKIKKRMLGKGVLGRFRLKGEGEIELLAGLFKDQVQGAKVLAHEIGHLVDWLPNKYMARGNILGRIASLKNYLKHYLENRPGAAGPLTDKDRVRLKKEARKLVKKEAGELIDEEIRKELPITPDDILAIWREATTEITKEQNPELYEYITKLSNAEKASIVKEAMKGTVPHRLKRFAKIVMEKTGRKIKAEPSEKAIYEKYKELIRKEIEKRRLFERDKIMNELIDFTHEWKPFDPNINPNYTRYRYSSTELYADALSAIITNPGYMRNKSPIFYEGFFNYLERKPEVKELFELIQDEIKSGSSQRNLVIRTRKGFLKRENEYRKLLEKQGRGWLDKDAWGTVFIDQTFAITRRVNKFGQSNIPENFNPIYKLEEWRHSGTESEGYLTDLNAKVLEPLKKAGLTHNDLGEYLMHWRISTERAEFANPLGWTPKRSKQRIEEMDKTYGPLLKELKVEFKKIRDDWFLSKIKDANMWSSELTKTIMESEHYVTFDIIGHLDKNYGMIASKHIYRQIGTFTETGNPLVATIIKDLLVMRSINKNIAAKSVIDFFKGHLPKEIKPADTKWNGRFREVKESRDPDFKIVVFMEGGKLKGYYLPKYVAEAFRHNPIESMMIAKVLRLSFAPFRALFTEFNPGFWAFNFFHRDYKAAAKQLPGLKYSTFLKYWFRAIPPAFRSCFGNPDELTTKCLKNKSLLSVAGYHWDTPEDLELDRLLKRYSISPSVWNAKILKPVTIFVDGMRNTARAMERVPKLGGYLYLKEKFPKMPEEKVAHLVRARAGSPDFMRTGTGAPIYNNLFPFSNAMKEGTRSAFEAATDSPGEYLWKTMKYNILWKAFIFGGLLGLGGWELKRILEGASDYDLANYNCYPIGLTETGKSVYIRIPQDETGRIIGGTFWLMAKKEYPKAFQSMFDYAAGQLPGLHPMITWAWAATEYMGGRNPFDHFRSRPIIDNDVFLAGGKRSHKAFAKWTSNQFGGGIVHRFKHDGIREIQTDLERFLNTPIASNVVGRFLKVSDYGIRQKINEELRKVASMAAEERLLLNEALVKMLEGKGDEITKEELIAMAKHADSIPYYTRKALAYKFGNVYMEKFITARSNEQKAIILRQMIANMPYAQKVNTAQMLDSMVEEIRNRIKK